VAKPTTPIAEVCKVLHDFTRARKYYSRVLSTEFPVDMRGDQVGRVRDFRMTRGDKQFTEWRSEFDNLGDGDSDVAETMTLLKNRRYGLLK
jgi:hypothetical protein